MKNASEPKKSIWDRKVLILAIAFIIIAIVGGWWFQKQSSAENEVGTATYVGRQSCMECHSSQCKAYEGSHHDMAMDFATSETVLANFDNQTLEHFGIESKFFKQGDKFMVHTEGADGKMHDFEVKYVFGVEPLQQYMVETKPAAKKGAVGTVQVLRLTWDTKNKKWFYLLPPDVKDKIDPGDPLHWTGITQNWNSSCAFCHSTNLQKNFDPKTNTFNTTFGEIDVSCEACHGPASEHVRLAKNRSFLSGKGMKRTGLHNLKTQDNVTQIETCAPCHSRRNEIADGYQPGCNYRDYFDVSLLQQQIYHCDGQIRDEVYVYGSYIQSKMYHNNIRCTDCHDPHTAKLKHEGNKVCTSCHQHPAAKYDDPSHHHHKPGSPGAQCVNCHMPATVYMAVDARRDHSLRVPRPDLSIKTGAPNACTGCHLESRNISAESQKKIKQYLDWIILREQGNADVKKEISRVDAAMQQAVIKWYGEKKHDKHFSEFLNQARNVPATVSSELKPLINRQSFPAIVRATAALELAATNDKPSLQSAFKGLQDSDPMVVQASLLRVNNEVVDLLSKLESADPRDPNLVLLKEIFDRVVGLTKHSRRAVRIAASRTLINFPLEIRKQLLTDETVSGFQNAFDELVDSLKVIGERGTAQRALGGIYEAVDEPDKAIEHYRNAIQLEPFLYGPRMNLAVLLQQKAAESARYAQQLSQGGATAAARSHAESYQRLMQEVQKLRDEEHDVLLNYVKLLEGIGPTAEFDYQLGMSFYRKGDWEKTRFYLMRAYRQFPRNEQFLLALATYFHARKNKAEAQRFVQQLLLINPNNPGYNRLRKEIDAL